MAATTSWAPARCRSSASGSCSSTRRSAASRPREAGIIFVVARLLDAFFSPVIGYISDHFHHTWLGQAVRPAPLLHPARHPAGAELRAHVGGGPDASGTTSSPTASSSWCTRWRSSRTKRWPRRCRRTTRPRRSSPARASSAARSRNIAAMWLPGVIIAQLGGKESADTFLYLGVIFSVFFVFVALAVYPVHLGAAARGDREHRRPRRRAVRRSRTSAQLFEDLWATLRIRAFRLHLGMYLGGYISQDIFNARVRRTSSRSCFLGTVATASIDHDVDGDARSWSRWASPSGCACASTPRLRIASRSACSPSASSASLALYSRASPTSAWYPAPWWSSPASGAARSTTFRGASTTTCPTSMKSSPAGGAKAHSRAS